MFWIFWSYWSSASCRGVLSANRSRGAQLVGAWRQELQTQGQRMLRGNGDGIRVNSWYDIDWQAQVPGGFPLVNARGDNRPQLNPFIPYWGDTSDFRVARLLEVETWDLIAGHNRVEATDGYGISVFCPRLVCVFSQVLIKVSEWKIQGIRIVGEDRLETRIRREEIRHWVFQNLGYSLGCKGASIFLCDCPRAERWIAVRNLAG